MSSPTESNFINNLDEDLSIIGITAKLYAVSASLFGLFEEADCIYDFCVSVTTNVPFVKESLIYLQLRNQVLAGNYEYVSDEIRNIILGGAIRPDNKEILFPLFILLATAFSRQYSKDEAMNKFEELRSAVFTDITVEDEFKQYLLDVFDDIEKNR